MLRIVSRYLRRNFKVLRIMYTKKKKKEVLKTVKSKSWYWKGSDVFGKGREEAIKTKRLSK